MADPDGEAVGEPHPQADRPFYVDPAVVSRREGDLEVLCASSDPPDDLDVLRDTERPDGCTCGDYRGVDPAAGVRSPPHEVLHLVAIEAADQEAQPEPLVPQLIGNQQVAIPVAERVRGPVDPEQQQPAAAAFAVGQVKARRSGELLGPLGLLFGFLDSDPDGLNSGDLKEFGVRVSFIERLFADVLCVGIEHFFVATAYSRNEPVQRRKPRLGSVHETKVEMRKPH